jgi:o-succinylbenzoate synthase
VKLRAVPYEVPYRRPIQTAHGTLTTRKGFWVLAGDDAAGGGILGLGEVAPLPEWGTETHDAAQRALASLPDFDLPTSLDALGDRLASLGLDRASLPATGAGVELACLDRFARVQGVTLASLLSEHPLERLPVNALLSGLDPEDLANDARLRVSEGFRTLKVKVGLGAIAQDVDRVRAVREAVGPEIRLRADANGAWDPATAADALHRLKPYDLEYLEQPVPDAAALASLHDQGILPLAADESATDPVAVRQLIAERAVDWLILKPMALGGLLYTRELALAARAAGIGVTLTSVLDRGIGVAGAMHLAAALGLESACGLSNTHMDPAHFVGPTPVVGWLEVRGPGHGVTRAISCSREVAHEA